MKDQSRPFEIGLRALESDGLPEPLERLLDVLPLRLPFLVGVFGIEVLEGLAEQLLPDSFVPCNDGVDNRLRHLRLEAKLPTESVVQIVAQRPLGKTASIIEDMLRHKVARPAVPLHRLRKRLRLFLVRLQPELDDLCQHGSPPPFRMVILPESPFLFLAASYIVAVSCAFRRSSHD